MITGEIKNKVDKIWTDIWAGGITNPLTVIEQLTYLMFIRSLDEKETLADRLIHQIIDDLSRAFVDAKDAGRMEDKTKERQNI